MRADSVRDDFSPEEKAKFLSLFVRRMPKFTPNPSCERKKKDYSSITQSTNDHEPTRFKKLHREDIIVDKQIVMADSSESETSDSFESDKEGIDYPDDRSDFDNYDIDYDIDSVWKDQRNCYSD